MTVPFQHKQTFREIFDFAGSVNKVSKDELHQFNAYIPSPFSQAVFDKYEPMCPLNVDNFMGFAAMGQGETGEKFDVISWGYVKGYAKHNLLAGEEKALLKDVRKAVDFTLKSSYKEPELTELWTKHAAWAGAAEAGEITADELVAVLKAAAKKPVPLLELLRSCQSRSRKGAKPPPKVTPPDAPAGEKKEEPKNEEPKKEEPKKEEPKKDEPPKVEPKKEEKPAPEPASPKKVVPPPPVDKPKPTPVEPAKKVVPPPPAVKPKPVEKPPSPPAAAVEDKEPAPTETTAPVVEETPKVEAPVDTQSPGKSTPVLSSSPTPGIVKPTPTNPAVLAAQAQAARKGQGVVSFDDLEQSTMMSQGSGGGQSAGSGGGLIPGGRGSFAGPTSQLAHLLNRGAHGTSDVGVGSNLDNGGSGGSRLPPEVVAMAAELDAKRAALKGELDKELDLLSSNNQAINILQDRIQELKAKNAVAPGDEAQYFLTNAIAQQHAAKNGSNNKDGSANSFTGIDLSKVEERMKHWINSSQQQQQLMRSEIHRLKQKEQLDASLKVISGDSGIPSSPYSTAHQHQSPTHQTQMSPGVYSHHHLGGVPSSATGQTVAHESLHHQDPHHHQDPLLMQPLQQPLGVHPSQLHSEQYQYHPSLGPGGVASPHHVNAGDQRLDSVHGATTELNLHSALRVTQFNEDLQQRAAALKEKEAALERIRKLQRQEQLLEEEIEKSSERDRSKAEKDKKSQRHLFDQIQKQKQYALERTAPSSSGGSQVNAAQPSPSPYLRHQVGGYGQHQEQPPSARQPGTSSYLMHGSAQARRSSRDEVENPRSSKLSARDAEQFLSRGTMYRR